MRAIEALVPAEPAPGEASAAPLGAGARLPAGLRCSSRAALGAAPTSRSLIRSARASTTERSNQARASQPREALAEQFDTSRSTIREALRLLAAWHLVRVVVGRNGGAYVARPDVAHVANVIGDNVALLTSSESVTLEAVLEARRLIEVPAAGLAADRCTDEALEAISAALVTDPSAQSADEQFEKDQRFHIEVLQATANPMVVIATQPLLDVIRAKVERLPRRRDFREAICRDHLAIYEALAGHDAKRACREMLRHLDYLRPFYAKAGSVGALQRARA